jgi:hypothetical protein
MMQLSIQNTLKLVITSLMVMFLSTMPVLGQDLFPECKNSASSNTEFCKTVEKPAGKGAGLFGADSLVSRATEAIIFITGAVSILMIVIGGLRYVLSNGDAQGTTNAKNTILYAVIGLVIALSAQAILKLVLQKLLA